VGVGVGVGVGVTTGIGVVAAGFTFQTSFLPLLLHVYFLPPKVDVCPAFLQTPPTLIAAVASIGAMRAKTNPRESRILFMGRFLGFLKRIATTQLV